MILLFTLKTAIKRRSVVRSFRKKSDIIKAELAIQRSPFIYRWPDGTTCEVCVQKIDSRTSRAVRSRNDKLFGWEWMADTIITHGKPMRIKDISQETAQCT
jgi:hypothetical protein